MSVNFSLKFLSHLIMTEDGRLIVVPRFNDVEDVMEAFIDEEERVYNENKNKKRLYRN